MRETVYPSFNIIVYRSVNRNVTEVILCDYLVWIDVDVEYHRLKFFWWCAQIKVFGVCGAELSTDVGDDGVQMIFDGH